MIELLKIDDLDKVRAEFERIGVDRRAFSIMDKKAVCYAVRVFSCKFYHASILKQEALSLGMDVAVEKDAIIAKTYVTDCLLFGDLKRILELAEKLKRQDFVFLRDLAEELESAIKNIIGGEFVFNVGRRVIDLRNSYMIMGVLNVTPDSFSDGGEYVDLNAALGRVQQMIKEGADIIDVGGESTRPGAEPISISEELKRVIPVVEAIRKEFPEIIISVDTYKSKVAKEALDSGADIINDISGLDFDSILLDVLSENDCGIVEMHIKGKPKNMQKNPKYDHVIGEINERFGEILNRLEKANIDRRRVVLDPGIGFGKRLDDNLTILNNIGSFKIWGRPILVGTSRKSFIGNILNVKNPKDRLFGTLSSNVVALLKGASIFRVHDVKAHVEALRLAKSIFSGTSNIHH